MLHWFFSQGFQFCFLVAVGAISGSVLRFSLLDYFSSVLPSKYWGTLIVNLVATFFLGLMLGLHSNLTIDSINSSPLILLFGVGFLGSLSTFSTFILELIDILLTYKWRQFFSLSLTSLFGGLFAALAGLLLGRV